MALEWSLGSTEALEYVTAVPRLTEDLECLNQLFTPDQPPICFVRSSKITTVSYGFGDASGDGFGNTTLLPDGMMSFRHGSWGTNADDTYFRELLNLVTALEEGVHSGELQHSETFIFTDNTTAERCFYKGDSPSRPLFQLVLQLRPCSRLRTHFLNSPPDLAPNGLHVCMNLSS
jgi:hypothetical protein